MVVRRMHACLSLVLFMCKFQYYFSACGCGRGDTHSSSGRTACADKGGTVLIPEENVWDHDDRMSAGGGRLKGQDRTRQENRAKKLLEWELRCWKQTTCWRTCKSGESLKAAPAVALLLLHDPPRSPWTTRFVSSNWSVRIAGVSEGICLLECF